MNSDAIRNANSGDERPLIVANDVGKVFCRELKRSLWYGLKDSVCNLIPSHQRALNSTGELDLRRGEFWANKGVSFELRRGDCLGLIGHNGAGKTTLLKMLNGLIKPDIGSITVRGRVGALIALGAGFNPVLTGRENVFVNGSVLGLKRSEIEARFDEIVDFAELADFIDAPVRTYSSGMQVRLGFAVATAMNPDVLLVDEVLAVGDAAFRNKCYNRLGALLNKAAVIFVSHNMNHINSVCNLGLLMTRGKTKGISPVETSVKRYLEQSEQSSSSEKIFEFSVPLTAANATVIPRNVHYGESTWLEVEVKSSECVMDANLRVVFYTSEGKPVMDWWSQRSSLQIELKKGKNNIRIELGPILLKTGIYELTVMLSDSSGLRSLFRSSHVESIRVENSDVGSQFQLPCEDTLTIRHGQF